MSHGKGDIATAIDLAVTDEQEQLRDTVRKLLAAKAPARLAVDRDGGYDPAVWSQLAELGLQALIIPEAYGGLGQGPVESWIVFEELGRALYNGPFLASVAMAANALLASGDDNACADLLPRIATGETVATLAVTERDGRWHARRDEQTVATAAGAHRWVLRGVKTFVVDGMAADMILVTARTEGGTSLFAVDAAAPGVTRRSLTTLDLTRSLAELTFAEVPARLVGAPGSAQPVIDAVLDRLLVAVAAESVGGMRACLDMCVGYAKTRKQFGVPIRSFQAVAHKCVDMLQRAEFGGAAVQYAAAAQAHGSDEFPLAARVAAAYCGPAYHWVTAETIQVHGGLGFTWEHDAHLYYRRCRSSEQLFGSTGDHYDDVATRAGL